MNPLSVAQAAVIIGKSASHTRKLIRENVIQGIKLGHDWITYEEYVNEYLAKRKSKSS